LTPVSPEGVQLLEAEAEFLLMIRGRKKKDQRHPKRHFERPNQGKKEWNAFAQTPKQETAERTRRAPTEPESKEPKIPQGPPHHEEPRPPRWKPLVPERRQLVTQEDARKAVDERLRECMVDQEQYERRQQELADEKRKQRKTIEEPIKEEEGADEVRTTNEKLEEIA
jgi:hypothetical protein